ncbi:hypothetical protein EJB05_51489, partial [Eragrostis curvula]
MVIQTYGRSKAEEMEQKLQRLQRVLIRINASVEEAEGRCITNQAMLRQLDMLRQGMYQGHYMLDSFRYRGHRDGDEMSGHRLAALPRFGSTKLFFPLPVSGNVNKLEKMLDSLETLMCDMREFVVFLEGYPRICRQPYSTYLILDKVMFGRQMELETVLNFLLRPEAAGDGNPGVLPVVGIKGVGKSTLVEHVCLDERVCRHFSPIVFFTGRDFGAGNVAALRESGVIKHQDVTAASHGRSLVVIELDGDMEEETWRRLYSSAASAMNDGSKIIVTSRSEKIASFGTAQALWLKHLPEEAYWYFFKTLAFGSTNPDDQPKLASLCMEIAATEKCSFLGANILGGVMRANQNAQFWSRLLQCLRDYTNKHLCTYGEHPTVLLSKSQPVYLWSMVRNQNVVMMCNVYQKPSPYHGVPKLRVQEFMTERVIGHEKFDMVMWRSSIPPYNAYVMSCEAEPTRCSKANKKRPRHAGI